MHAKPKPELDFIGGYFEDGKYKCYQEPCFSIHKDRPQGSSSTEFDTRGWPHWLDIDQNCQKEHQQLLVKKSNKPVRYENDDRCKTVTAGEWVDFYTGEVITDIEDVVVDHRVSLKEAHALRGLSWPIKKRAIFANTPDNLIVVSKASKVLRQGRPPDQWMPSDEKYWCDYIVHREKVARLYKLSFQDSVSNVHRQIKRSHCHY